MYLKPGSLMTLVLEFTYTWPFERSMGGRGCSCHLVHMRSEDNLRWMWALLDTVSLAHCSSCQLASPRATEGYSISLPHLPFGAPGLQMCASAHLFCVDSEDSNSGAYACGNPWTAARVLKFDFTHLVQGALKDPCLASSSTSFYWESRAYLAFILSLPLDLSIFFFVYLGVLMLAACTTDTCSFRTIPVIVLQCPSLSPVVFSPFCVT